MKSAHIEDETVQCTTEIDHAIYDAIKVALTKKSLMKVVCEFLLVIWKWDDG